MKWRQFVSDYFEFSKKDRIGYLLILFIIGACLLVPLLFSKNQNNVEIKEDAEMLVAVSNVKEKGNDVEEGSEDEPTTELQPSIRNSFTKGELFVFDPNLLSEVGWKKLGLADRNIKTIMNYRNKGGKFYQPGDLKKIWGLPEGFYDYVSSYISIQQEESEERLSNAKPEKKILRIDINIADTSALIALPGIGSKLANRIISFREKLGGFYTIEQISETYGLADSSFQKIKPLLFVNGGVHKININSASKDDLKIHPYIKWNLANAIIEYRNQHGNYTDLDALKNITIVDEATFRKIEPYLSL